MPKSYLPQPPFGTGEKEIRDMEMRILERQLRFVESYPDTTTSSGEFLDFSINSTNDKIAIKLKTQWKSFSLTNGV